MLDQRLYEERGGADQFMLVARGKSALVRLICKVGDKCTNRKYVQKSLISIHLVKK